MTYIVKIKPKATKFLKKITTAEKEKIEQRIAELAINPRNENVIKLTNKETYRARQGDYRIFFTIQDDILYVEVIEIKHRQQSYKQ